MTISINRNNGSLLISDIIGNRYISHVYYGYTKREAVGMFKELVREELAAAFAGN